MQASVGASPAVRGGHASDIVPCQLLKSQIQCAAMLDGLQVHCGGEQAPAVLLLLSKLCARARLVLEKSTQNPHSALCMRSFVRRAI